MHQNSSYEAQGLAALTSGNTMHFDKAFRGNKVLLNSTKDESNWET